MPFCCNYDYTHWCHGRSHLCHSIPFSWLKSWMDDHNYEISIIMFTEFYNIKLNNNYKMCIQWLKIHFININFIINLLLSWPMWQHIPNLKFNQLFMAYHVAFYNKKWTFLGHSCDVTWQPWPRKHSLKTLTEPIYARWPSLKA
jgi:hypothetical protein